MFNPPLCNTLMANCALPSRRASRRPLLLRAFSSAEWRTSTQCNDRTGLPAVPIGDQTFRILPDLTLSSSAEGDSTRSTTVVRPPLRAKNHFSSCSSVTP
jgi:hypothetical protein